ncbi:hypothetical protein JFL47_11380 [Haemophilus haemoglobinophilus]|nr:hypothetical protein [Canicola haemoglobinophilus]MBN6711815.1 hypothetical protein [Canicola haemoglobinophilus]
MAIYAYVGVPGSGKTYEVVKSVILPAFIKGRKIVTNIEGVEEQKFIDYIHNLPPKEFKKINLSELGSILKVTDDDVTSGNFFPYKGNEKETIAKLGDLICLDEVWRIFDEKKITEEQRSFIAEHRHFVNDVGETSDLVVINQSVSNIPRFIKDRIQSTFKMTKLISLGLSHRYRVDVFAGTKLFKTNKISSYQEKYNPAIFKLYNSYDQKNAKEQNIDDRVNLFKKKSFIFMMILAFLFFLAGIFLFIDFFNKYQSKQEQEESSVEGVKIEQPVKVERSKPNTAENNASYFEPAKKEPNYSTRWRIVGFINKSNKKLVILDDGKHFRYEYLHNFNFKGNLLIGEVDGKIVTVYSGKNLDDITERKGLKK